jgi:arginase
VHTGRTVSESGDLDLSKQDGIQAKDAVIARLASALKVIDHHNLQHILTLGGDCSVSVVPFSWLAQHYGADLAVLWIDSHPDRGTPSSRYSGYYAMVVAVLSGHGNPDMLHLMHRPTKVTGVMMLWVARPPYR